MLGHLFGTFEGWPKFELLGIEMATTNSILDPWIYIIFRRETFNLVRRVYYMCRCMKGNFQQYSTDGVSSQIKSDMTSV